MRMIRFASQYARVQILAFAYGVFMDIATVIILCFAVSPVLGLFFAIVSLPITLSMLLFFRDPNRRADREEIPSNEFICPADGTVTDISEIDDSKLGGKAMKIGIFMSVFDVHVNRCPCYGKVIETIHTPGEFLDARKPESSLRNERNDLIIEPKYDPIRPLPERIIVRQIAGLIAKRIVCAVDVDDELKAGERIGMIKFGSRVELIVPVLPQANIQVKIGQKVKAGDDILITY